MNKKSSNKSSKTAKAKEPMSADEHRKIARTLHAKASIHNAKADLAEAQNPKKSRGCPSY